MAEAFQKQSDVRPLHVLRWLCFDVPGECREIEWHGAPAANRALADAADRGDDRDAIERCVCIIVFIQSGQTPQL
jgi:hypothetical protein